MRSRASAATEIEQLVANRVRQWLLDPGSIYQATQRTDLSVPRRLVVRAAEIGQSWPKLPATRQRGLLTDLIERINIRGDQIDIHIRTTRLAALLDVAAAPSPSGDDETQILSVPVRLRRFWREIKMLIEGDPFATAKPDARLIKLLIRAHRFNATLVRSAGAPFAALAKQEGVSPSYFTRLVRRRSTQPTKFAPLSAGAKGIRTVGPSPGLCGKRGGRRHRCDDHKARPVSAQAVERRLYGQRLPNQSLWFGVSSAASGSLRPSTHATSRHCHRDCGPVRRHAGIQSSPAT